MNQLFVIGDIHGQFDLLKSLLTKWNIDNQKLIFLGDYIDHGYQSHEVILLVQELCENYGATALSGNHEDNFLQWIDDPEEYWYTKWLENPDILKLEEQARYSKSIYFYKNGGDKTLNSLYNGHYATRYKPIQHSDYLKKYFQNELSFLKSLPVYYEYYDYIFVHAGIDFNQFNWKETSPYDFRRIRDDFHKGINHTNKTIVFGHHLTRMLNENESNDIWISPCKTKIGIDGGASKGGLLHGLVINDNHEYQLYSVNTSMEMIERKFKI